ncbi:hypothetical protein OIU84_027730 [Salix udensis]|uniref:Uncharacterized protein n=1 Tax=Salix udensis TaxID=889485 RepID=A0AAD6KI55_9ROSI|nr:hypothetical protein OIU84_027730 [Salix udensis]
MGACATKPKALKEGETPEPAMEEAVATTGGDVQVEDKVVAVDEEDKKVVFEKDFSDAGGDKVEETEIVDDNKRRSLSNLFKEVIIFYFISHVKILHTVFSMKDFDFDFDLDSMNRKVILHIHLMTCKQINSY